jgi:hypothetical protein
MKKYYIELRRRGISALLIVLVGGSFTAKQSIPIIYERMFYFNPES